MNNTETLSVDYFLNYCLQHYSQPKPWEHPELNHGTALLHSEESMNAYIAAYGEMHILKCQVAMQNFPLELLKIYSFEIFDWGCGQGIASMCMIEKLQQRDLLRNLKRVTLIEPSQETLNRANYNVSMMFRGNSKAININVINSCLPGTVNQAFIQHIDYQSHIAIHLFSNILDINSIDLKQLARSIANNERTQHIFLCIGPKNQGSNRIDLFGEIFGSPECFANIDERNYSCTKNFHPISCKIRCFQYKGLIDNISYDANEKSETQNTAILPCDDYDEQYNAGDLFTQTLLKLKHRFEQIYPSAFIIIQPELKCQSPDLMVIVPRQGVIIAQIFADDIQNLEYLDLCQKNIVDMLSNSETFDKDWARFGVTTVKKIVVFTRNTSEEANTLCKEKYTITLGNDFLDNDENWKSNFYFRFDRPKLFSDERCKLLINQITPKWHSWQEGKPINLSNIQEKLAKSIRTSQKISGVAGSGKTQVIVHRAVKAQIRTGGKILIVCYNKSLVGYIKQRLGEVPEDFPYKKFTICHYHGFIKNNLNKAETPKRLLEICDNIELVKRYLDNNARKYNAIFVDEVQDFKTEWLQILQQLFLVNSADEFVVFGDPKQNVYNRALDKNGDVALGVIKGTWNHELNKSFRFENHPKLDSLAQEFRKRFLSDNGNAIPVQLKVDDMSIVNMLTLLTLIN